MLGLLNHALCCSWLETCCLLSLQLMPIMKSSFYPMIIRRKRISVNSEWKSMSLLYMVPAVTLGRSSLALNGNLCKPGPSARFPFWLPHHHPPPHSRTAEVERHSHSWGSAWFSMESPKALLRCLPYSALAETGPYLWWSLLSWCPPQFVKSHWGPRIWPSHTSLKL